MAILNAWGSLESSNVNILIGRVSSEVANVLGRLTTDSLSSVDRCCFRAKKDSFSWSCSTAWGDGSTLKTHLRLELWHGRGQRSPPLSPMPCNQSYEDVLICVFWHDTTIKTFRNGGLPERIEEVQKPSCKSLRALYRGRSVEHHYTWKL